MKLSSCGEASEKRNPQQQLAYPKPLLPAFPRRAVCASNIYPLWHRRTEGSEEAFVLTAAMYRISLLSVGLQKTKKKQFSVIFFFLNPKFKTLFPVIICVTMKISLCPVGTPRPSSSLQPIPPPFPLWACLDPHVLGYSPIHRPCVKAPKAECHLECCWEGSGKQGKCLLRSLGYVLGTVNSSCVLKDVRAVFKHSYLNNPNR